MSSEKLTQLMLRVRTSHLLWLLHLGFWVNLWLSLQAGDLGGIFRSGSLYDGLDALRTVIPQAGSFA